MTATVAGGPAAGESGGRGGSPRTTPLIDTHVHVISTDLAKYPVTPIGGVRSDWSRTRPVTADHAVAAMGRAGVQGATLVQSSTTYGFDNSYLADSVERFPGYVTGVVAVDLMAPDCVSVLDHLMASQRFSGIRLFTTGSTVSQAGWLDDPRSLPGWSWAADHRIPVTVQLSGPALPQLQAVLERIPELIVVLDHAAMGDFSVGPTYVDVDRLHPLIAHPGAHVKVSTRVLRSASESRGGASGVVRALVDAFGASRLLWGSGFPAAEGDYPELVELFLDAIAALPPTDADEIGAGTARRLYPALAGTPTAAPTA